MPSDEILRSRFLETRSKMKHLTNSEVENRLRMTHYKDILADRYTISTAKMMQKNSAENRTIYVIKNSEGVRLEDQLDVLKEIKTQYEKIFQSVLTHETDQKVFFTEPPYATASDEQRKKLDANLNESEIKNAIHMFRKCKSPGIDGLPIEFYICFQEKLTPILKRLYTVIFEQDELSESMYNGVISQIYKGTMTKRI
jgi:site-specific DNA-adenine methylase